MAKEKSLEKMELASSPSQVCPVMSGLRPVLCLHELNLLGKPVIQNRSNCKNPNP